MKISNCILFLKNILNRTCAAATATSIAFIAEECMVAVKSIHMSNEAAYNDIKLFSSYLILGAAFIEPIAEILIDKVKVLSAQRAKSLAKIWYTLLDMSYTACICLYFFDSFNHKSELSYWYAVVLPTTIIALIANKELRMMLRIFPTSSSSRIHRIFTQALDTFCEAIRGFILGYDVIFEIGYEITAISSLWISCIFGLIYSVFHSTIYHFKQLHDTDIIPNLAKLDEIFQTVFNLLTIIFFILYINSAIADTYPHKIIQISGYAMIVAYIIGRPCFGSRNQPLLDEVAEEEEGITKQPA